MQIHLHLNMSMNNHRSYILHSDTLMYRPISHPRIIKPTTIIDLISLLFHHFCNGVLEAMVNFPHQQITQVLHVPII